MAGQDGFARDLLGYDSTSNTVMAGLRIHPNDRWDLGFNLTWTTSEAGLDPFSLTAPEYVETHPSMAFDFSESHTYSDLDTSRIDAEFDATYHFNKTFRVNLGFRYADFSDDAPYLYDTSGTMTLYTASLGWSF